VLADTGPLVAMLNRRDRHHARARQYIDSFHGQMLSTWPVVAEVCHLVPTQAGMRFMQWVAAGGLHLVDVPDRHKREIASLIERYADRPMDIADATLLWVAATTGVFDIITVDEAGFAAYRTPAGKSLRNRLL
jgi:predicted nucleic acid-binding protein